MSIVVAIVGLMLLGAWIDQILTVRARKRRERHRIQWWKDPDDEGDY